MADDTTTPVKPGYKTTEFWLALAAIVVGVLLASGAFGAEGWPIQVLGVAQMVLAKLGYTWSRTALKKGDAKPTS